MWMIYFFLNYANLICQGMDISKFFRESLGLWDNERWLSLASIKTELCEFIRLCVEVLGSCRARPVYLTNVYWAGLVLYAVNQYCAHSFARNWQLPFLNQRKGENDRRKYFMINLYERMLPTSAGVEPATSWSPVGRRIRLSHRGRLMQIRHFLEKHIDNFLISPWRYSLEAPHCPFFLFLHKNVCCGQLDEALLMNTHNLCFHGEIRKKITWSSLLVPSCITVK